MLEDYYEEGKFHEGPGPCLDYIAAAGLRGNPLELAFIKLQALSVDGDLSGLLLEAIDNHIDLAVHHAITTLLYRARRHPYESPDCQKLVDVITLLMPAFEGYTQEDFEYYLYGEELKQGTYWSDLTHDYDEAWHPKERHRPREKEKEQKEKEEKASSSSSLKDKRPEDLFYDSDEDEEHDGFSVDPYELAPLALTGKEASLEAPRKVSMRQKSPRAMPTHRRYDRDLEPDPEEVRAWLITANKGPLSVKRAIRMDWSTAVYRNSFIHHPKQIREDEQIERDLEVANRILADLDAGELGVEDACYHLAGLSTKFALAQYRGIAYNTTTFNALARQRSLEAVEVGKTVYASAVFSALKQSPADYYAGETSVEIEGALMQEALRLRDLLNQKHHSGPIVIDGKQYDNHALALHDFYTNSYDAFRDELKKYLAHQSSKQEKGFQPPPIWEAFQGLTGDNIPFVSSGDVPQHALRYAYGSKYYPGHQDDRLRPRWRKNGKAEFPYAGKVYSALFSLTDYLKAEPHHVPSLNVKGKLLIRPDIVGELETCFAAFLPAQRIMMEHVARYPSFPCAFEDRKKPQYDGKGYRKQYFYKYGLTEEEYEIFWELISKAAPHSEASKTVKVSLGNWLIHYHEVRLVEMARRLALKRRCILVYRHSKTGLLTMDLEELLPIQHPKLVDFVRSGSQAFTDSSCSSNALDLHDDRLPMSESIEAQGKDVLKPSADGRENLVKQTLLAYRRFERLLTEALTSRFILCPTATDGNAIFHAVAGGLARSERFALKRHTHVELRQLAVEYVCQTAYKFATVEQGEQHALRMKCYADDMFEPATHPSQERCWGSDLELEAIANVLGIKIRLYSTSYVLLTFVSGAAKLAKQVAELQERFDQSHHDEALLRAIEMRLGGIDHYMEAHAHEERPLELFLVKCASAFLSLFSPSQGKLAYQSLCNDGRWNAFLEGDEGLGIIQIAYPGGVGNGIHKQLAKKVTPYGGLLVDLNRERESEDQALLMHIKTIDGFQGIKCYLDFTPGTEPSDEQPDVILYHTAGTHFFFLTPR